MLPCSFRTWLLLACGTLSTACVTEECLELGDADDARDCDDGSEDEVASAHY